MIAADICRTCQTDPARPFIRRKRQCLAHLCPKQMMQAAEFEAGRLLSVWHPDHGFVDKAGYRSPSWSKGPLRAFLPEGYPTSVTDDYARFQLWDSIQAICSYVRGILSSQAMLTGVGVGQQAATPLSAVFQFFLRDLSGMLGGVTFAFLQGSKLDVYAKQWRLFADCLNSAGLILELASPIFPSLFLLLACLGSVARAITGVAAGATRAALTLHFAKQNNAADIAAKEGTQETATTLIGMLLGMAFTHMFNGLPWLIWVSFLSLTVLHVYANIRAVRALTLTSLNPSRLQLLVDTFYQQGVMLTPLQAAEQEPLAPPPLQRLLNSKAKQPAIVIMGASLRGLVSSHYGSVSQLCKDSADQPYLLVSTQGLVHVVLAKSCQPADVLKAFVHARVRSLMIHTTPRPCSAQEFPSRRAKQWMQKHWQRMLQQIQTAGWETSRVTLAQSDITAEWGERLSTHDE